MRSKGETLDFLRKRGLNVPDYHIVYPKYGLAGVIETLRGIFGENEKVSLRCWSSGGFKFPFNPNKTLEEQVKFIQDNWDTLRNSREIILALGIDPEYCLLCGKAMSLRDDILLEFIKGPGTVRDMEKKSADELHSILVWPNKPIPTEFAKLVSDCIPLFRDYKIEIVEWSIYLKPVGILNENLIYWEVI